MPNIEPPKKRKPQRKSHITRSSAAARQKGTARKRAKLHRILLPDAPPRKRRTLNPSPERSATEFLPTCSTSTVSEQNPELEAMLTHIPLYVVPEIEQEIVVETTNAVPIQSEYFVISLDGTEPHVDTVFLAPSTSETLAPSTSETVKGIFDVDSSGTAANWMDIAFGDVSDDDIDDNSMMDGIPLPVITSRIAIKNPADDTDLTPEQEAILCVEEEADDRYVRESVASDISCDFAWTSDCQAFTGKRESFSGSSGPTFPVTNDMSPVDVFNKMFDDDFFEILVTQTNHYAEQVVTKLKQDSATKLHNRRLSWRPTDRNEMVAFLAIIILQGLYPKVKEESYFTFDGYGTTPYFRRIMSYDRYYQLKTLLHFSDNDKTHDQTKLRKIRPILDYFNKKFASLYTLQQEIAIDESLLKWTGRLSFSQKISCKAAKVGVKTYELCESSTGYLWTFRVCTGKHGPSKTPNQNIKDIHEDSQGQKSVDDLYANDWPEDNGLGLSEGQGQDNLEHDNTQARPDDATSKIVYDLLQPLLGRGHTLIMDNFYNSPLLARCLKQNKTDVFGTLRLARKFVPEALKTMTMNDMRKGEVVASYCSDLALILWRDTRLVSMISTYHPLQVGISGKNSKVVYKPAIIFDYNKYMGGVDRKDQFLSGQPLERSRNKVWYKKLFRRLYNAALFNSFIIFTSNKKNKMNHRVFRTILVESLLKIHQHIDITTEPRLILTRKTPKTNNLVLTQEGRTRPYIEENHFPIKTGFKATRCWMCTKNKTPKRTVYKCEECNVNLCIIGCFKAYHKPTGKPMPTKPTDYDHAVYSRYKITNKEV